MAVRVGFGRRASQLSARTGVGVPRGPVRARLMSCAREKAEKAWMFSLTVVDLSPGLRHRALPPPCLRRAGAGTMSGQPRAREW